VEGGLVTLEAAKVLQYRRQRTCGRAGPYAIARLIREHGRDAGLHEFLTELTADCPRRRSVDIYARCGAQMPDLPRVV
jgi:hypothetical protein